MNKAFLFVLSLAVWTVLNLYVAMETNLYQDATAELFFVVEVIIVASLGFMFAGLFGVLSLIWTFLNVAFFIAAPVYGWEAFVLVESLAVVLFFIALRRSRKEDLALEEEEQRQFEISEKLKEEGKETVGTISDTEHIGGSQTGFEKTYELRLSVDTTPPDRMPFTCKVTTESSSYDLASYRPGNMVKIRYMNDDPEICEFVETLDKPQTSTPPVQNAKQSQSVVCPFCKNHFDLSESAACPNCRAPYVN